MGIIETRIKIAFGKFKESGNLLDFAKEIADVGDKSVNSKSHAAIMYDAIRTHCPPTVFECVYYDGEHGEYHLLDFDPNQLDSEALIVAIEISLEHEIGVELDYIDKAMESVYLLNSNTLVKVVIE